MDQTIRTIRQETRKNRRGVLPSVILVVDTNIVVDLGWGRDEVVRNLVGLGVKNPKLMIVTPKICSVEFLAVTLAEVRSLNEITRHLKAKLPDVKRYGDAKLIERIHEVIEEITTLAGKLRELPEGTLERLTKLICVFEKNLAVQFEEAYYISKNPKYGLKFEDALVFSFVKLFGIAMDDCKVIFLTKDRDFDTGTVMQELSAVGVDIYFSSGECMQRIREAL